MSAKTGIELIAEKREGIKVLKMKSRICDAILLAERADMYITQNCPTDMVIGSLVEAGALIAAEIDRINNLKQE